MSITSFSGRLGTFNDNAFFLNEEYKEIKYWFSQKHRKKKKSWASIEKSLTLTNYPSDWIKLNKSS